MAESVEFGIALRRVGKLGKEIIQRTQARLQSTLRNESVRSVVLDSNDVTHRIKRIRIVFETGDEMSFTVSGIDHIVLGGTVPDKHVQALEKERSDLNKKWHILPP